MVWVSMTLWRMTGTAAFLLIASSLWKRKVNTRLCSNDRTHVKGLKNLVEVQPPDRDRLFVVLRVEVSGDHVPFTPLD